MNRVVITGIGVVSPIGVGAEEFYGALVAGVNGIAPITAFDTADYKAKLAAEVKGFDPEQYIDRKDARRMDRYCQLAVAAAQLAAEHGRIGDQNGDPWRSGAIVASGVGGINTMEQEREKLMVKGPGRVSPFFVPQMISNMAAGHISMRHNLRGPSYCPVSACSSGAHAVGEAFRLIKHGYADLMFAGGAEAAISPLAIAGFSNMTALSLSGDADAASLPFDARRSGFVMGEGAAVLIMESLRHAKARGARIICEVAGYGATSDAYHITSPDPEGEGAYMAMRLALEEADMVPAAVDYINAHGTGTPLNDRIETKAIRRCFVDHADSLLISSTKSMTGHLLGAAGAVESAVCALTIAGGVAPPTINLTQPDPECDLNYVPCTAVKREVRAAMTNSLGFGGHNVSLLFKKIQ